MNFSLAGFRGNLLGAALIAGGAFFTAGVQAQLPPQITGTVKEGSTQAAVAGAKVSLFGAPGFEATTDENGAFTLLLYDPADLHGSRAAARSMRLNGTNLAFSIAGSTERVKVTLHDLRGHQVAILKDGRLPAGDYTLSVAPAALPAGLFVVRAIVGGQSKSFRMSTLGGTRARFARDASSSSSVSSAASSRARLGKRAVGGVDFLNVSKEGYLRKTHEVMVYTDTQAVTLDLLKPATANMGVFTDSVMPMIDWANAAIYSWAETAVLLVDSTNSTGFDSSAKSMGVASMESVSWNGWAFHVANTTYGQPTTDLRPYAEGSLHLAIKGNAPSVGVMISSTNQGPGSAPLVDLATKGYLPDSAWHEIVIPISEFAGGSLDLSSVFVYAGFVSPAVQFGTFDPLATYQVDEVYFIPKQ